MLVRALRNGFYKTARVRQGSEFHLHDADDISCIWMQPLDEEAMDAWKAKEADMRKRGIDVDQVKAAIIDIVSSRHNLEHGSIAPGTLKPVNTHSTFGQKGTGKGKPMKKTTAEKLPQNPAAKGKAPKAKAPEPVAETAEVG